MFFHGAFGSVKLKKMKMKNEKMKPLPLLLPAAAAVLLGSREGVAALALK